MRFVIILLLIFTQKTDMTIFNFSKDANLDNWYVVNDGVMGGLSKGKLTLNEEGIGEFSGDVSLDNNGGFTAIRLQLENTIIDGNTKAVLKVKGDGKPYQFRLKSDSQDYFAYCYTFNTTGNWENIEIPLNEMYPSFRGRKLDMPNYPAQTLEEMWILIGNKKAESFALEIDKITLK